MGWEKAIEQKMGGGIMKKIQAATVFIAMTFLFSGCDKTQQTEKQVNHVGEFNKSNKSIETNGNVAVAMTKIVDDGGILIGVPAKINIAELTKSPYSSIGKPVKVRGKIYKLEELPRDQGLQGRWAEILMLSPNKNDALGVSTIDFFYAGDISTVNPGDIITCSGYFVGTFQSQNAMGGAVESLVLVGNQIFR